MKQLIVYIVIMLAIATIASANDTSVRLVVIAEDVSAESRALADLLTADLARAAGIEMVERSEIDRVLAEQKLTAVGLAETASRVQLGRLLKADGLVLTQKDIARQTRILVRMVEAKNGFLAGYYQYPFTNVSMDKIARDAEADIHTSLPKLRADPTKMQRVAISRIGNATLRADYEWLESDLPVLLAMTFSAEPGVLLMERRQLGEALNEAHLAGDKATLKTGNVLIDGEVALIYGQVPKDGAMPIAMTLRFRDATLKEIGRVSREGRLTDLDKLTAETMALALTKLREIGQRPAEKVSAEPEMLLKMAKRHGYVWAADAAYALSPTNTTAKNQLINQLLSEALASTGLERSPENILDRAKKLARAVKLCREENSLLINYMPQDMPLEHDFIDFLFQPQTMLDADIRAVLKPVRETFRREIEARQAGNQLGRGQLLEYASAFFDNPLDYFFYTRGIYEALSRNANTAEDRWEAANYAFTYCIWPSEMYMDMAGSPDPVTRYFALIKLMRSQGSRVKRQEYAVQAAGCFDDVLKFIPWLIHNRKLEPSKSIHAFYATVQDMINASPDLQPLIYTKVCAKFNDLLDQKDYYSLPFLKPQDYIPRFTLSNAVPLADRILAEYYVLRGKRSHDDDQYGIMIRNIEGWILTNGSQYAASGGAADPVKTLPLLSSESPEWRKSAGQLAPAPAVLKHDRMAIIPQRLLIDGNILWIGLGGKVPNESPSINSTGLMKVDLNTGKVLSCRYGKVKGDEVILGSMIQGVGTYCYAKSVLPIVKLHDYILVGQSGIGVLLYPQQADPLISDLSDVTIINNETGLLSNQLLSIAALNDRLFIMTRPGTVRFKQDGKWITRTGGDKWIISEWHQKTRMIKIIADSEKQIGGRELQDNILNEPQMMTDPTNDCLQLIFTLARKYPDGSAKHVGEAHYTYAPSAETWRLVATNALTESKPVQESTRCLLPKGYKETYDVQNYKEGALAITGYGEHWKLVFFHREGDETAARWAQEHQIASAAGSGGANPTNSPAVRFLAAVRQNDLDELKSLQLQGADVNAPDDKGITPLIMALRQTNEAAVVWLIQKGADIHRAAPSGATPLMWAVHRQMTNVVTTLLAGKANLNLRDENGRTALSYAAETGSRVLVHILLNAGASDAGVDKYGHSILMRAAHAPIPDALALLLARRHGLKERNEALFCAVKCNQINNVALLLKHGADVNAKDEFETSLLIKAAINSEPETLQFLIDHGAAVNDPINKGSSALMMAASQNRADNMRALLRAGADLLYVSKKGDYRTVFTYAQKPEARAVILEALGQYLLRTGMD